MRKELFSVMMSKNWDYSNQSYRISKIMMFAWMVLLFGLLVTESPLIASEPGEVMGPVSCSLSPVLRRDDLIVALQSENEYLPDKLHYTHGEIVTVKYEIRVNTASRGYKPNRTYYVLSPYVTGYQIKGGGYNNFWYIVNSDIDTLETITDDRSLKGEITLQLSFYKEDRRQVKGMSGGGFMYFTPMDTTAAQSRLPSGPPRFYFEVVRIAESDNGDHVYLHNSGKFYYDQEAGISFQGKVESECWENRFNRNSGVIAPKDNSFIPSQPDFRQLAAGGYLLRDINVLKNSTLVWNINQDRPEGTMPIESVELEGPPLGCSVCRDPTNYERYILTTGNTTGEPARKSLY